MIRWVISAPGYLLLTCASLAQVGQIPAWPPAQFIAGAAFQGPGDVVTGAVAWGSCARVYTAAQASTATPLCDLVDSAAPTVVICTLRGSSTGFVDLTGTYCTGSVTPATKCAAATGGTCNVSQIYDQTGNGHAFTNATAASQPKLTFSALNGLPGMIGTSAGNTAIVTGLFTILSPATLVCVAKRTSVSGNSSSALGEPISGNNLNFGFNATTGLADLSAAGNTITASATENVFHALQGISNGASPASGLVVDGVLTTGTQNAITNNGLRFFRSGPSNSLDGIVMECGAWPSSFIAGSNYTPMNTNLHGASGYNF